MQIHYTYQELVDIATRKELRSSRQLARQEQISFGQALFVALTQATQDAGVDNIEQLALKRKSELATAIGRKHGRRAAKLANKKEQQLSQTNSETWLAWFDGSALPNPGKCRVACILQAPDNHVYTYTSQFEHGDSCDAEYCGLILALKQALRHQVRHLQLYGDSQVVIDDFNQVKMSQLERMREYREQARELGISFESLIVRWIPRHKNQSADALTQVRTKNADF